MPTFDSSGNHDFMSRSNTLRKHGSKRTYFDPTNDQHCDSLKIYLETGRWGDVQFYPEFPHTEVPATVLFKYAAHGLKIAAKNAEVVAWKEL